MAVSGPHRLFLRRPPQPAGRGQQGAMRQRGLQAVPRAGKSSASPRNANSGGAPNARNPANVIGVNYCSGVRGGNGGLAWLIEIRHQRQVAALLVGDLRGHPLQQDEALGRGRVGAGVDHRLGVFLSHRPPKILSSRNVVAGARRVIGADIIGLAFERRRCRPARRPPQNDWKRCRRCRYRRAGERRRPRRRRARRAERLSASCRYDPCSHARVRGR